MSQTEIPLGDVTANQAMPLAARMRPSDLKDFEGQRHLLGTGRPLAGLADAGIVHSMILWGPPGTGKTTLAKLLVEAAGARWISISAVLAGVKDVRRAIDDAGLHASRQTVLFVDEVHRFNKAQQDAFLPHVEKGEITLIGATTENPSFEVISPLLSRSITYVLNPLEDKHIQQIILQAISDSVNGLGGRKFSLNPDSLQRIVAISNGDARTALNILEISASATDPDPEDNRRITLKTLESAMQGSFVRHDKNGDLHYDTISAFIKSVRGSDPDAAIYWLARMLEAGEDPMFICRRMIILASEDIGVADPIALNIAVSAQQAVHFVGFPEGAIPLAEAAVYLATAPKSNSTYSALNKASKDAKEGFYSVPLHLRNAHSQLSKELGYGKDYRYPHNDPSHFIKSSNLPDPLKDQRYYYPSNQGYEKKIAERIRKWWGVS